jgi:hypothetical protein
LALLLLPDWDGRPRARQTARRAGTALVVSLRAALSQTRSDTKGGFYWHFDDRNALLEEMLDTWERLVVDEATARVDAGGGDPKGSRAACSR